MSMTLRNEMAEQIATAAFCLEEVTVRETSSGLHDAVDARIAELRARYPAPAAAAEAFGPARKLYRSLGIDPSKHRPSSEALLRRVLQGKGLYTVNTAVDAANLASLTHHLPVGLYDLRRVSPRDGAIVLRLGTLGEEYEGIRKGTIHLEGRATLFDAEGPFGNPSSDSFRTRVTLETSSLLFVLFAPAGTEPARIERDRDLSMRLMQSFVGGRHL